MLVRQMRARLADMESPCRNCSKVIHICQSDSFDRTDKAHRKGRTTKCAGLGV